MSREPVCVRRTFTVEEADLIVAWLKDKGIEATVVGRDNPGIFAFGVTDLEGVGVYVADPQQAERARALLTEHDRRQAHGAAESGRMIDITCNACKTRNTFPFDRHGTVQECTECGSYLDVPDVAEA